MKSVEKHYLPIAALMAGILAACALLTALMGTATPSPMQNTKRVVTTSYPLYIAVSAVAEGVDGVTVENLIGSVSGCLHDYQLTPANRVTLDHADLVLMGSVAAEPFVLDVLPQLRCPVVDTVHNRRATAEEPEHDHDHDHDHAVEEHAWMQSAVYTAQIQAATEWLARTDPAHAAQYQQNAAAYRQEIVAMQEALTAAVAALPTRACITFHDSVRGFAEGLGLTVLASLSVGEDAGVSAGDLAAVQAILRQNPDALLLYDDQYSVRYDAIDRLVPARQVLALDTVVAGDRVGDDWMDAMKINYALLRQVTEE